MEKRVGKLAYEDHSISLTVNGERYELEVGEQPYKEGKEDD